MTAEHKLEVPIKGMDCAECASHVRQSIASLPGVTSVDVLLSSEKAIIRHDPDRVNLGDIRGAVKGAGYEVGTPEDSDAARDVPDTFSRQVMLLLGAAFGVVLFIVVIGEVFGFFDQVTDLVPWPIWLALVILGGYPIFRNVVRAALNRQIIAHTLMTIGMLAAIIVGEWATALIVVFFMRVSTYVEQFTAERARSAVRDLTAIAPQKARIERDGVEAVVPVGEVQPGDIIVVRPGDQIPVDGVVMSGQATVNQAAITGESMPVEVESGTRVFAATFAQLGSLRIRATGVGADTTFGRVIKLVEEAEAHRADVQRLADRFSGYYLPVVVTIATLTFLFSRDPLATAAVLVVACSCSFALATPIAVIASVGASARRGLVIKGGRYLESLARADVLLVDKTGTLTLGQPQITDIISLSGMDQNDLLRLTATAERDSEHPLAEAVRRAAAERGLSLGQPEQFEAVPGQGVRAHLDGSVIAVGNVRMLSGREVPSIAADLQEEGKTLLLVTEDDHLIGVLAAADTVRSEVPAALERLRQSGLTRVVLITGDNEPVAASLASRLGIDYRANLLPEDKIGIVKEYQDRGHTVVMVGDGVNDAPALAQADIGIAMGAAGTPVAIEAAHIALMRDDWMLVPEVFQIARRTMGIVKGNLGFTVAYNTVGLTLAAIGILPPALAAAAQSIPDIGIMGNSSRLLRQRSVRHVDDENLPALSVTEPELTVPDRHAVRFRSGDANRVENRSGRGI